VIDTIYYEITYDVKVMAQISTLIFLYKHSSGRKFYYLTGNFLPELSIKKYKGRHSVPLLLYCMFPFSTYPGPRKRRRKRPETYENGGKRLSFTITFTMHRKTAK